MRALRAMAIRRGLRRIRFWMSLEFSRCSRCAPVMALLRSDHRPVSRAGRPTSALFVGRGPLLGPTKERARERGLADQVRFVEWVDDQTDLARIYAESRVAVCASTCEGGPRVTVEAMACGTPVVSTPVGMMRELVRDGENGWLCGFDVDSLTRALGEVLGDEERRLGLGDQARQDVQRFEKRRVIQEYAEGVQRLAGGGGSR